VNWSEAGERWSRSSGPVKTTAESHRERVPPPIKVIWGSRSDETEPNFPNLRVMISLAEIESRQYSIKFLGSFHILLPSSSPPIFSPLVHLRASRHGRLLPYHP